MARRMRDPDYRAEQEAKRFDEHIAPINTYVDEIRSEAWAPYVAPIYGGVNARLLYVLRDPGPKTQDDTGSGFLCWENDDATAETICRLCEEVGIVASDAMPWNAYPWYINRDPKAKELEQGVVTLKRIIDLLPNLQVVLLLGKAAQDGWDRLERRFPTGIAARNFKVIRTFHTSRQAFFHPDPEVRDQRRAHIRQSFANAARYLAESNESLAAGS